MLYRTKSLGVPKGTRRFRLGRRRESTRQPSESILQTAWILRSPIGSHIPVSTLQSGGTSSGKEKSAVLYQELAPTSLSLANYCVCIVIMETGSAAPCHDTFQSIRGCGLQDKCSRCEECVSLAPAFASSCRGGFGSLSPFSVDKDRCRVQPLSVMHGTLTRKKNPRTEDLEESVIVFCRDSLSNQSSVCYRHLSLSLSYTQSKLHLMLLSV
jgi:hypothetical protein